MATTTLSVRRISPWSVFRISAALGAIGFLVWLIAVGLIYFVLEGMGFWSRFAELAGGVDGVSPGWVLAAAAGIGVLWWILCTALATLGAFIYNACTDFVGGVEVMVKE